MGATLSRRDFVKYCAATAAVLGLSQSMVPRVAQALEQLLSGKTPILWLMGQGCGGCQASLLNSDEPSPGQLLLESFSLRFFPLLSASSGELALTALNETVGRFKGGYVLLIEGTIPVAEDGKYATMGREQEKPIPVQSWVQRLAVDASAALAVGTCAAYGGIPVLGPTSPRTVEAVLQKPVTAIPGCPPHPDWIVGTLVKVALFGEKAVLEGLDNDRRPKEFFGGLVHDNCPRRAAFDAGVFARDFNDNARLDNACLLSTGCKGPVTHSDCALRRWNQRVNWCIGAGAPCNGCTEPSFYSGLAPLFDPLPSVELPFSRPIRLNADVLGGAIAGATAVGVGAHLVFQVARGRFGEEQPDRESEDGAPSSGEEGRGEPRAEERREGSFSDASESQPNGVADTAREEEPRSIEGFYGPRSDSPGRVEKVPAPPDCVEGESQARPDGSKEKDGG